MNLNVFTPPQDPTEHVAATVNEIGTVMNTMKAKWFISFGALLYFVRDKNMGIPFDQDFDISVMERLNHNHLVQRFQEFGFALKKKVVNNQSGYPFQMVFKHPQRLFSVDVFFWVNYNGYWWHTYDYYHEEKKNGMLSKYVFKGTPERAFKGDVYVYPWVEIAPPVNFPALYGTLLDHWYPGWFVPDKNFGQSHAEKVVKIKDCLGLEGKLK